MLNLCYCLLLSLSSDAIPIPWAVSAHDMRAIIGMTVRYHPAHALLRSKLCVIPPFLIRLSTFHLNTGSFSFLGFWWGRV